MFIAKGWLNIKRVAKIMLWKYKRAVLTRCDPPTGTEGVSLVTMLAPAHSIVLDHWALGVRPAGTRARVTALFIDASLVAWAFTVYDTLRATVRWGANVSREARAGRDSFHVPALSITSAWVTLTWVCHYRFNGFWCWKDNVSAFISSMLVFMGYVCF